MRILFVCMIDSITAVRWVDQLRGTGWDVHVFPSIAGARPHPGWRDVTLHDVGFWRPDGLHESVKVAGLWPWKKGAYRVGRMAERFGIRQDHARVLVRTIRRLRPDIVHSLEMQHAGYLTLDAWQRLRGARPEWIYSAWGSDLYHFRNEDSHRRKICDVLATCGSMMADCRRDHALARELGFRGRELGVFPGGGGFEIHAMTGLRHDPPSGRRVIALKGYQNVSYGGRALLALQAVHRCADVLADYEVVVYGGTNPAVKDVVEHIRAVAGIRITAWGRVPRAEVVGLFGKSRVHLAMGTTDGSPNAMLEAMVMGAFPVQSDTVSTGEWIESGRNGMLVPPEDLSALEAALRRVVSDDDLVDRGAEANAALAAKRLDRGPIISDVVAAYRSCVSSRSRP